MKVAVWDTYVKKKDGNVMHFDIIVPQGEENKERIFGYGKTYIASKSEPEGIIDTTHCQFCHIEDITPEIEADINRQGYYILEMDEIPASLPENPTKRDLVFHLKAHYKEHRFRNFKGVPTEEIQALVSA